GYENQLHFSRAFKTIYGVSPREWRNQQKNTS
ncbi:MAG: AraC family transcriptional regulator, partial [Agathobacter sp.]|nr:AraC family transcriptional regulator [Agathobacter sp.]